MTPIDETTHIATTPPADDAARRRKKTYFALGLGGIAGFLGAMGVLRLMDSGVLGATSISQELAGLVALIYLLTGLAVLFGLAAPNAGAKFLNVEDADELREQKSMLLGSGIGMVAMAAALMIAALGGPEGIIAPVPALTAYVVLMLVCVWASVSSWRKQDELMRAIGSQTGALAFYLTALIGGSWALLGHLGLAAGPAPLDWLTMLWAFVLLAAFIAAGRRGMLAMR